MLEKEGSHIKREAVLIEMGVNKDKRESGKLLIIGSLIKLTKTINRPKAPACFANYFIMG